MPLEPLSLTWFVVWAIAVAVVAVDVGKTKVFAWLRLWVNPGPLRPGLTGSPSEKELEADDWYYLGWRIRHWAYSLICCPWCLGHWLSAAVCLGHGIMNPAWWLVLTGAAAVPMLVYCGLLWLLEDPRLDCERSN